MTDSCFGRTQYLDILVKRVTGLKDGYRQNVALIGDEFVGKTTIMRSFLDSFFDSRFLTVYLEARQETFESFCRRFIGALLYNFLLPSSSNLREDPEFLIEKASSYVPATAEKIRSLLAAVRKHKRDNAFAELLSLPEQLHAESGKFCVIILDEFHNLERLGMKKLYKDWSQLLMVQKNTMYVIASSAMFRARAILSKELSLLFGNFEVVQVEPFDVKTSEQFLDRRFSSTPPEGAVKKFITHLTGGSPYYLSVIADSLDRSPQLLPEVLEGLLFESAGVLNQRFGGWIKRCEETAGGEELVSILCHIAGGCNKIKDVAHMMHRLNREIAPRVAHLVEIDMIRRSGDFLIINDRLFGFWLRDVYRERLSSLTHDLSNQKKIFHERINALLQEFIQHSSKPVPQRMAELFRLFADERIQVERKNIRLDRFREIKPLEFGSSRLRDGLICRSNDSIWILAFSSGSLTEDDIADFSRECKKYRNKMLRKIIVNFSDLDHNSHLKALEEKIITWDLNRVNQILDLYSRPRIIA
jgi:hypothetical protein